MKGLFVLGLGLFSVSANAFSDSPTISKFALRPGFHALINGGLTFGGDTLVTVTVTTVNTNNSADVDINAGRLLQYGVGGLYQFEAIPVALKATVNYQSDWAQGINGLFDFSRVPVEFLAYYTGKKRYRFGGGVRLVNSPKLVETVDGISDRLLFDNTTGVVAEMGYQVSRELWVNLRYVSEKYQPSKYVATDGTVFDVSAMQPYKGSHLGLILSCEF
jgi:hypothetical protein